MPLNDQLDGLLVLNARQRSLGTVSTISLSHLPLFASEHLNPLSVTQGQVGNCAFIASVVSLAARHPQMITECITKAENGLVEVTFHVRSKSLKVSLQLWMPVIGCHWLAGHSKCKKESWVSALEQANCLIFNRGTYDHAESNPTTDLFHLTGWIPRTSKMHEIELEWLAQGMLDKTCVFCLGTDSFDNQSNIQIDSQVIHETTGLISNHCYAVVDINAHDKKLLIRNTWSFDELDLPMSVKTGSFWVEWTFVYDLFSKVFSVINPQSFTEILSIESIDPQSTNPISFDINHSRSIEQSYVTLVIMVVRDQCDYERKTYLGLSLTAKNMMRQETTLKNSETVSLWLDFAPLSSYSLQFNTFNWNGETVLLRVIIK